VAFPSSSPSLAFGYGVGGHRTLKQVGDPDNGGYREHYIRDAQGNIMAVYRYTNSGGASTQVVERPVYGSSRLGSYVKPQEVMGPGLISVEYTMPLTAADQRYELTDHLGNVSTVVTGRLLDGAGAGSQKQAEVVLAHGYEPGGSLLPGRNYNTTAYRFGAAGGQEKDDEIYGSPSTSYTADFWQYDPRIVRRWNVDPMTFPWQSSYAVFNNNPVVYVDPWGLFATRKEARQHKDDNALKGRIRKNDDGHFSIDDKKAGTSIFRDAEFGLSKAALVEARRPDNATITPFEVGTEWLTGRGARERDFLGGDHFTELYKTHEHVEQTRNKVKGTLSVSGGTNTDPISNRYDLSGIEGVGKYVKDYSTLATAGATGNLAVTYLGSHNLTVTITSVNAEKRIAVVTFSVHNTSTIQSATRPPVIGYQPWYQNTIGAALNAQFENGPMSETTQTIEWSETIKY